MDKQTAIYSINCIIMVLVIYIIDKIFSDCGNNIIIVMNHNWYHDAQGYKFGLQHTATLQYTHTRLWTDCSTTFPKLFRNGSKSSTATKVPENVSSWNSHSWGAKVQRVQKIHGAKVLGPCTHRERKFSLPVDFSLRERKCRERKSSDVIKQSA